MEINQANEFVDSPLEIGSEELVLRAGTFTKWPQLEPHVPLGTSLIVSGVATDCCVLAKALQAMDAGRRVVLISDGCAALNDRLQEQALDLARALFPLCRIVDSKAVLQCYAA